MTVTRNYLRQELQKAGFSYRESRRLVTVIIDAMTDAVKKGELDTSFGKLTLERKPIKRAYRFNQIVRINRKPTVHFRRKD